MDVSKLLSLEIVSIYNFSKVKRKINEIFSVLNYFKIIEDDLPFPTITPNYKVRYNQFTNVRSSRIENFVIKKIMLESRNEEKRTELFSKITIALKKLNEDELKIFNMMFYENRSEEYILANMPYCSDNIWWIKKSACIKFLTSLGLDKDLIKT